MAAFEVEVGLDMRHLESKVCLQVVPEICHNQLEAAEVAG
jgi:hypothetical protein